MERIGIVTVLYNSEKVLEDFFNTLNIQTFKNFTLYVIDNLSPDNSLSKSRELAKKVFFKTHFIANPGNYGVAKGNNQGILAALADNCDYVLLSNNDIVLKENTIELLFQGMVLNKASLAIPKIYFYNSNKIWCAGGKFNYYNAKNPHFGYLQEDNGNFDEQKYVDYSPTCFMLIHQSVFDKVGIMDENYFVYFDDSDFTIRALKNGHRILYIPGSTLEHKEGSSTGGGRSLFHIYYYNRNIIYFVHKNFSLFHKLCVYSFQLIHFLFRKLFIFKNKELKVVLKATAEGIRICKSKK